MKHRLSFSVGTVLLALAACKTTGVTWDYAMDASYNGANYSCSGLADMEISSGRIEWDSNKAGCSGAEQVIAGMPQLPNERIIYDQEKGWVVDPAKGWLSSDASFSQCSVELPHSTDTSEGVLIHCGWQCDFDQCQGNVEYRIVPTKR